MLYPVLVKGYVNRPVFETKHEQGFRGTIAYLVWCVGYRLAKPHDVTSRHPQMFF